MANKYAEHLLTQGMYNHSHNQGCGTGSGWIRIGMEGVKSWIHIRIHIKAKFKRPLEAQNWCVDQ
jgi:hypothetical protein